MIKLNKKSQIGATLTWILALLIIFFVIVIFISVTLILSVTKSVSYGRDEIKLIEYKSNLESQEILFNILGSKIYFDDKESKIKDVLKEIDMYYLDSEKKDELREKIKSQTEDFLRDLNRCYIFRAVYGTEVIRKNTLEFSSLDSKSSYVKKQKKEWIESSVEVILLRNEIAEAFGDDGEKNQIIQIKFYLGDCL